MNQQQNLKLVRNLFDNVFTGGNADQLPKYVNENVTFTDTAVPNFKGGLESLIKLETQYAQAFPNKKLKIDDILATDNKVIVYWTVTAKHQGTLAGYTATGNKVSLSGISIYTIGTNGKIDSVSQVWDRLALLEQIGQGQPLSVSS